MPIPRPRVILGNAYRRLDYYESLGADVRQLRDLALAAHLAWVLDPSPAKAERRAVLRASAERRYRQVYQGIRNARAVIRKLGGVVPPPIIKRRKLRRARRPRRWFRKPVDLAAAAPAPAAPIDWASLL